MAHISSLMVSDGSTSCTKPCISLSLYLQIDYRSRVVSVFGRPPTASSTVPNLLTDTTQAFVFLSGIPSVLQLGTTRKSMVRHMKGRSSAGQGRGLAAALKNHQGRIDANDRARAAARQKEAAMKNKSQGKGIPLVRDNEPKLEATQGEISMGQRRPDRTEHAAKHQIKFTIPFEKDDRILLVGEGEAFYLVNILTKFMIV